MKYIITLIIAILFLQSGANAQLFSLVDSSGKVITEIPLRYKAYTYNNFSITDTSIIITSTRDKFDLILREPGSDQNLTFLFSPIENRIKAKSFYNVKIGESIDFTVNPEADYTLKSNSKISINYILDENGKLTESYSTPDTIFDLSGNMIYGFRYTPETPGNETLNLTLQKGKNPVEKKILPLVILPDKIILKAQASVINDFNFEKIIGYRIISSRPLPSELILKLIFTIEINHFEETIEVEDIHFPSHSDSYTGVFRKEIRGRRPKKFNIKNIAIIIKKGCENNDFIISTTK